MCSQTAVVCSMWSRYGLTSRMPCHVVVDLRGMMRFLATDVFEVDVKARQDGR